MNIVTKLSILFVILVIIIIIVIGCTLPKIWYKQPLFLLKTNDRTIELYNYDTKEITDFLKNGTDSISAFAAYHNQVYYGVRGENKPIYSSSGEIQNLTFHAVEWTKTAIAVDYLTKNLYILDGPAKRLYAADLQSNHYSLIDIELDDPKDISLDAEHGHVFILQSSSIIKAKIGSTEPKEVLVKHPNLNAFTANFFKKILYYSNGTHVNAYQYEKKKELTTLNIPNVSNMATINDRLFFIETTSKYPNKTLMMCDMETAKNNSCELEELYTSPNLTDVKFYEENPRQLPNYCNVNVTCDQMCLTRMGQCGCTEGWKLKDNKCHPADKLFVNVDNTDIVEYQFDRKNFSRSLVNAWDLSSFQPFTNNSLLYATKGQSGQILCTNDDCKLPKSTIQGIVKGITLVDDDMRNVVYVVDEIQGQINVAGLNSEHAKTLFMNLNKPKDVVVDAESGLMFIQEAFSVKQANMDGSNTKVLVKNDGITAIALDPRNKKLYIAVSSAVVCIDYRTNQRNKVTDLVNKRIISLAVVGGDLYAIIEKDIVKRSIQKCHLVKGSDVCEFLLVHENDLIVDIKSKLENRREVKTACSKNNGGCERLCLLRNDSKRFSCA